jgi:hypothetical protein
MSHDTALDSVRNRLSDSILTGTSRCTLWSCSVKLQISTSYRVTPTSSCFHITVITYSLLNYPAVILHEAVQPLQLTQTRSVYYELRSCALLAFLFFLMDCTLFRRVRDVRKKHRNDTRCGEILQTDWTSDVIINL